MKKSILIIFDNETAVSASNIANQLKEKYEIISIGVTNKGRWLFCPIDVSSGWEQDNDCVCAVVSPDKVSGGIIKIEDNETVFKKIDLAFPLIQDRGQLQGLLTLSGIPYIGSDITATVSCCDNAILHSILEYSGVKTAKWKIITERKISELESECEKISQSLGFPVYVKPVGNNNSSTRADNISDLKETIKTAFTHSNKIIIEEYIRGREFQVAILGNEDPASSFAHTDGVCSGITDAVVAEEIRNIAKRAYKTVGCKGLAIVNILQQNEIFVSSIEPVPDLSENGTYCGLLKEIGIEYDYLLEKLIQLANIRA